MSQRMDITKIAPEGYKSLSTVGAYLKDCSIEPRLRALVELRVSQINGCAFCVDRHAEEARKAGEKQQRLDCLSVWRDVEFFDDRERAALTWAEVLTLVSETDIPDDIYDETLQHLSEKELADLTLVIVTMNAWNRISIAFRRPVRKRKEQQ